MFTKNKRLFVTLLLLFLSLTIHLSFCNNVFSIECSGAETSLIECEEGGDGGVYHILILVIDILSIGVGILALIGILWAGIQYLTAKSDASKAATAKRRIGEIVLGLAVYAVLFSLAQWLLPGGFFNIDKSVPTDPKIAFEGEARVEETIYPKVIINDAAKDKTYTLMSSDPNIALVSGRGVRCVAAGNVTITATAVDGKEAKLTIECLGNPDIAYSSYDGSNSGYGSGSSANSGMDTTGDTSGEKFNGKAHLRKETKKIIDDHDEDFYHTGDKSYEKVVLSKNSKYGSYEKYVRSLGGVFTQFIDEKKIKVKTAADLQAAAEYVFGLQMIWGPDYWNGTTFWYWGNKSTDETRFYRYDANPRGFSYGAHSPINNLLAKSNVTSIQTHCNSTMHRFIKSTNLKYINTGIGRVSIKNTLEGKGFYSSKFINDVTELRVGDLVNFDACTGHGGHVAMVGEVYKDKIVMYDGGSRFVRPRNYKKAVDRKNSKNGRFPGDYSMFCNWYGYRPWDIDQSVTLEGIN